MMIGKSSTRPIPAWDPSNDPADNFPAVSYSCNAPCSPYPVDYMAALHRYLPSNDLDSDVAVVDAFSCDHFRMYEFKVRRCARARSHDWTDCPYAHPGEKARRRDPMKFHYAGSICPDFRKGSCKKGDSCEFAHGVFECWLHPTRYRTQSCKDGTGCKRRVCIFAHAPEQLRVVPQQSPRGNGSGSGIHRIYHVSSPTSILAPPPFSPPSESPPRSSMLRPGSLSTPTRPGLGNPLEEPAMERVESGRDLRERMYAKLSKDNSLDPLDPTGSGPDVGWVWELVVY
ncbi:Zinc finger CCCH domain-containing protein 20 [Hibiscus syriacus]|uniref:Zinc finger CCCH domain-containing protein 20 n=1 Tax=Hibiscus syriacus TaxID=106335 RepID=A0A6A2X7Y7_HIBSY|nr:Zinc finger CCCH domain-containing protein 20 [Hibiscus syriacus]